MTNALAHLTPVLATVPDHARRIDLDGAEAAARELLIALGVDAEDDSVRDTPRRMARSYAELLTPTPFTATTFPNDAGY